MNEQLTLFPDNPEYDAFVAKFEPKKTTDDCYTPPLVYEAIKNWACAEYGIDPESIVRPFYPGGDYEHFDYSGGAVVLDNPPFSILSQICEFYLDRGIPFFLFAPSLTVFSGRKTAMRMNHIVCDCHIRYDNGALVRTAFVTSYGGDVIAQTAPSLLAAVSEALTQTYAATKRETPKYEYPDHVLTAAMLQKYSKYGIDMKVRRGECTLISALDAQREQKKTVFGSGLLLSERAAAERAAAERAAAERADAERADAERADVQIWELSPREWEIARGLG